MPAGTFFAVDAPVFSPDGKTILFSAVGEPQPPKLSWLDQLLGVQVAEAHNVPSDWWRVAANGSKPEQLTHVADTGLYADFAPDGQHVAFVEMLQEADCVVIATAHQSYDWAWILEHSRLVVDTRNVTHGVQTYGARVVKL